MRPRRATVLKALGIAAALVPAAAAAAPAVSDAPLGVRTQGSFRELFLDVTLADARALARPELDVRWAFANDWSTPALFVRGSELVEMRTDEQADSLTVRGRVPWVRLRGSGGASRSWLDRASTAVEWRLTQHWGGWTDGAITSWHRVIDVYDFQRERYPRDGVQVRLGEPGGRAAIDYRSARLAAGDLVARTQLVLASGGVAPAADRERWAISARLDAKAPLGRLSQAGGSGGWDAGAALLATVAVAPWLTAHAMTSLSAWSRLPAFSALQPRRWHAGAEASLAFRLRGWALLVEDRVVSPLFERGWSYVGADARQRTTADVAAFRTLNQVSVGIRRGAFTVWASEDVTPGRPHRVPASSIYMSNAPDIVVGFAYSRAL